MLTWDEGIQEGCSGIVTSVSYTTRLPHWGEAHIHADSDRPGEMFLDCPGLDIHMRSLGRVAERDTLHPAEMVLLRALEQRGVWCLEAMVAIGGTEG